MDQFLEALPMFLTVDNFAMVLIGVIIGVIIGAIPGMTTPMGVALALPFTFSMAPVTGILLLLGIYKGGMYGGSITAILLKTPGTPAAACTVLDGYPMAQKGQARRALEMALYASCVADFISNFALILFSGMLAGFALRFGPPEFFTLILFSLTIIAGVSGDSLAKGAISACLGLIAATVGLDIIYGTERFVYGNVDLMAGLNFIPVLIGLFALPEIINYYIKRISPQPRAGIVQGKGATFADFKKCFKSIIRGSFIGVFLGTVPGIGGAPSAFLSYSEARRTSDDPSKFGTGEIEGVAAAEAGNNGVAGSTMIPLLALGVPGDVITAVILGAFMIHGLKPGPIMFTENLPIIYSLFMGIMLSSVYLFVVGKFSIKALSKIANLPNRLLYPVVITLCVFGCYAVNNSTFDILVMAVMGVVGFVMLKFKIPAAPFLIAYILGPMLEDSFRQSLLMSAGHYYIFFQNAICWVFWALSFMMPILMVRSKRRNAAMAKAKQQA